VKYRIGLSVILILNQEFPTNFWQMINTRIGGIALGGKNLGSVFESVKKFVQH